MYGQWCNGVWLCLLNWRIAGICIAEKSLLCLILVFIA